MCGVVTIASLDGRPLDRELACRMTEAVRHRGPDSVGLYSVGGSLPGQEGEWPIILLGYCRLAIFDLTELGHQPMSWDDLTIVYNGAIHNYLELRSELEALGHSFVSKSDTEVLLHSLREWGLGVLARLNGIFAFVLWDARSHELIAARDHLGVKPLYFSESSGRLFLASEIKALLPVLDRAPGVSEKAIYDFLTIGRTDHTQGTFFEGIQPVPPGCSLILREGHYEVRQFWRATVTEERHKRTFLENAEEFRTLITDSTRLRMRADVPVTYCLSGGLDSTSLVCIALQHGAGPLPVFTARFRHKAMDEWSYANAAQRELNVQLFAVYVDPLEFWDELDRVVYAQEEPFGGPSVFAQWRLMKEIHHHGLKVVLDGQGADEVLCGYAKYFYYQVRDLWRAGKPLRACYLAGSSLANGGPQLLDYRAARRYFPKSWWLARLSEKLLTEDFRERCQSEADNANPQTLIDMQHADIISLGLPSLLRYEDRNSMAHSVEARVPFLDYRVVDFALSIPTEHKIHGGQSKLMLREALRGVLPEIVRKRKSKLGFGGAWHLWIKDLQPQIATWLKRPSLRIDRYVKRETLRGQLRSCDPDLFRSLVLDRWLERFVAS